MSNLRKEVLSMFKKLHLTRKIVFEGDERALTECRKRMNDEFKKNKQVSNEDTVKEMIKFGNEVEQVLRTSVIQATTEDNETLKLKLRPDTLRIDNVPFNENADIPQPRTPNKRCKK